MNKQNKEQQRRREAISEHNLQIISLGALDVATYGKKKKKITIVNEGGGGDGRKNKQSAVLPVNHFLLCTP